jgi:UDP-N-acetyl-D-glucosamine dehydrogenase
MSKLLENSYRAVNIGLVNELKVVCEKVGLDINAVIDAASTKPFGYNTFRPGPGVGGHCIPIDPVFISWVAKKNNYRARFIELARRTNLNITQWTINKIINLIKKKYNSLKIRILVIGVSYKPDVNDIRESPSASIFLNLLKKIKKIDFYDPYIPFFEKDSENYYSINNLSKINKYDIVLILTNHSNLDYKHIFMQSKLIVDTRGVYKKINSEKIFHF